MGQVACVSRMRIPGTAWRPGCVALATARAARTSSMARRCIWAPTRSLHPGRPGSPSAGPKDMKKRTPATGGSSHHKDGPRAHPASARARDRPRALKAASHNPPVAVVSWNRAAFGKHVFSKCRRSFPHTSLNAVGRVAVQAAHALDTPAALVTLSKVSGARTGRAGGTRAAPRLFP